jgi:hypothetical protein
MNCPACGEQMNHHADKLDPTGPARVIAQIHTCRKCGHVECVNNGFGRTLNGTDASFRRG